MPRSRAPKSQEPTSQEDAVSTGRGGRRRLWKWGLLFVALYLAPVLSGCMNISTPVDYLMNSGVFGHDPDLAVADDGVRRVVVLRHGLYRSAGSMWKLERALEDHGYETVNSSYPSTSGYIEDHADMLAEELRELLPNGTATDTGELELYFVGHSMGGVQLHLYLSRFGSPEPTACVFIATPHRGSALLDKRKDWLMFKVLMGDEGVLQLSPSAHLFRKLVPLKCDVGVIFGGVGDGEGHNDDIPGDDDGTVGIDEAQLPEAKDRVRLDLGHTRISFADSSVHQVLYFLKHRQFDYATGR